MPDKREYRSHDTGTTSTQECQECSKYIESLVGIKQSAKDFLRDHNKHCIDPENCYCEPLRKALQKLESE